MPIPQTSYLAPPPITKNFLISPPGSPPEGWEPIIEEPPNDKTLAEDLAGALEKVQLERRRWEWEEEDSAEVDGTFQGGQVQPWELRTHDQEQDQRRTSLSNSQEPSPPQPPKLSEHPSQPASSSNINSRNPGPAATGSQVILQTSTGVIVSVLPPPPAPAPPSNGLFATPGTHPRVPTAMPPRDISQVKATVESMQRREEAGRGAGA